MAVATLAPLKARPVACAGAEHLELGDLSFDDCGPVRLPDPKVERADDCVMCGGEVYRCLNRDIYQFYRIVKACESDGPVGPACDALSVLTPEHIGVLHCRGCGVYFVEGEE